MSRVRRFCVALFEEKPFSFDLGIFSYLAYQQEKCPTTGRLHWQTYFELITKNSITALKKILHPTAHFIVCKGSKDQNYDYCTKSETSIEGTFAEFGEPMRQGKRNDLSGLVKDITDLKPIWDIVQQQPNHLRLIGHIEKLIKYRPMKELRDVKAYYFWGKPGKGKSWATWLATKDFDWYKPLIQNGAVWFDGYGAETVLIIEDFDPTCMSRNMFLNILDKYPYRVGSKGSSTMARWHTVYFTSNTPPLNETAFTRRFTEIIEIKEQDF